MQFARYAEAQCERACEEGSNLCKLCTKYEEQHMAGKPGKWHGRKGGPIPAESHIIGSAWAAEQNARNAARAAKIAGAAAAGGGGGEAKVQAKVAKAAAKEASVAAVNAGKIAEKVLKAVSNSEEKAWEMARGRAGMTISRGANVVQIARGLEKEEQARQKAAVAAEKAQAAAGKAVKAAVRSTSATRRRSSSGSKTRKGALRIYAPASGMAAGVANWLRTPSSPRAEGIRGHAPSPASRRSTSKKSTASRRSTSKKSSPATASPGLDFGDLEAELAAAMGAAGGPSVLNRNSA